MGIPRCRRRSRTASTSSARSSSCRPTGRRPFPTNRVKVLLTLGVVLLRPIMVPAVVMIGVWALLQFVNGIGSIAVTDQTSGVAYWAHIGGFIAGVVITLLAKPFLDRGSVAPSRVAAPY